MSSTEGRQKVVKRVLVREIDERYLCVPLVFFRVKEIVIADREIEQISRCNAGRIMIIVFCAGRRDGDKS